MPYGHVLGDFLLGISDFLSNVVAQGALYSNGYTKIFNTNYFLKLSGRERKESRRALQSLLGSSLIQKAAHLGGHVSSEPE